MVEYISWFATGATIIAALVTASNLGARVTGYGFVVFFFGSIAWLTVGLMTGQPALFWTNAVLVALNIFGIWRWLGRQARIEEGGESAQKASHWTPGEALFPASLLGRATVVARDGGEMGRTVDAMVGCRSGSIAYLIVSAGGVAGVGEQLRRVDWARAIHRNDRLELALTGEEFEKLPMLDRDNWPAR